MARTKRTPVQRASSSEYLDRKTASWQDGNGAAAEARTDAARTDAARTDAARTEAGVLQLVISVAGIYASFLTWAYLQEKLTMTPHGPADAPERWHFPVFLNTVQSLLAAAVGLA
ncbi:hypothetical protein E4U41_005370, partial [Claviceps citrina]